MKIFTGESGRDSYRDHLKTPEWRKKVELMRWLHDGQCLLCGSPTNPEVHHKHYRRVRNEPPADLGLLCDFCHRLVTYLEKYGHEDAAKVRGLCRLAGKIRIDLEAMRGFWSREIESLTRELGVISERVEMIQEMYSSRPDRKAAA